MSIAKRCWTAYEKNQLLKHAISLDNLDQYGDMPVEYITGFVEFCGHQFEVNPDTLIPRTESEGLVNLAINWIKDETSNSHDLHILDVGTGCGNIAISVFLGLKKLGISTKITASDISKKCLDQAKNNQERLIQKDDWPNFSFYQSDLLSRLPQQTYKIILANLPYVPSSMLEILDPTVKYFEPNLALDGGTDGLELVRQLISSSSQYLDDGGKIMLEIDSRSRVNENTLGLNQEWAYQIIMDEFERQRYVILTKL
jgi:release factor glutamine methyltransferase